MFKGHCTPTVTAVTAHTDEDRQVFIGFDCPLHSHPGLDRLVLFGCIPSLDRQVLAG